MTGTADKADWKHFQAWANGQKLTPKERAKIWNLFKSDRDYYADLGWSETRRAAELNKNPGRKAVHTKKFDRCVRKVKRRSGKRVNAYAVCASRLPKGGVKKSHRKRQKNLKSIAGAVIVVHTPKHVMYYSRDNLLSSNRTAAKVFQSKAMAASRARQIARLVPYKVTVNKP